MFFILVMAVILIVLFFKLMTRWIWFLIPLSLLFLIIDYWAFFAYGIVLIVAFLIWKDEKAAKNKNK